MKVNDSMKLITTKKKNMSVVTTDEQFISTVTFLPDEISTSIPSSSIVVLEDKFNATKMQSFIEVDYPIKMVFHVMLSHRFWRF